MSKSAFIEQTRGPRAPVSNIDRHGHKGTSVLKRHCNVPLPEWGRERAKEKQSVVNNVIKIIGHANVILRAMQESNNEHHVSSNELNHMPLEWSFFFIYISVSHAPICLNDCCTIIKYFVCACAAIWMGHFHYWSFLRPTLKCCQQMCDCSFVMILVIIRS